MNLCDACAWQKECEFTTTCDFLHSQGCSKFLHTNDYVFLKKKIIQEVISELETHAEIERGWENFESVKAIEASIQQLTSKFLDAPQVWPMGLDSKIDCCAGCGAKNVEGRVAASAFGAFSEAFCDKCLASGRDSYSLMVNYIACAGCWPDDINEEYQKFVRQQLELHGKTEQEFIEDLTKYDF